MISCDDTLAPAMDSPTMDLQGPKQVDLEYYRILSIRQIPAYTSLDAIQKLCANLPGLESVRRSTREDGRARIYELFLIFQASTYGFNIVGPTGKKEIVLDRVNFSITPFRIDDPAEYMEGNTMDVVTCRSLHSNTTSLDSGSGTFLLDRKSFPVPECNWCLQEVDTTDISTPCLKCKNIICQSCVERNAQVALRDRGSMPLRCCWRAIHPTVLKGVLSVDMHKQYVSRLEEMHAKLPFYCPVNTCSEFIPPRKLNPVDNMIHCPACDERICFKCRQSAHEVHVCSTAPTEADEILEKFSYKLCPHCGHGQQKLFGCNHVRCPCGTHWCWGCSQGIYGCECNDDYYDDDISPPPPPPQPIADPSMNADISIDPTTAGSLNVPQSSSIPSHINLDDPNIRAWESEDLDLGEEPSDENEILFDCSHDLKPLFKERIPRYWITAHRPDFWDDPTTTKDGENQEWERHVECTSCQSDSKITTPSGRNYYLSYRGMVEGEAREALRSEAQKLSYWCNKCGSVWCRACKHKGDRLMKKKVSDEDGETSEYFEDEC